MPPTVFADTFYWLALAQPRDAWHSEVTRWSLANCTTRLVTTDEVLVEFLNSLAGTGAVGRTHAATIVQDIRSDIQVQVLPQTRTDFDAALAFYQARIDKAYSLTDCRSMLAMRQLGIADVLSHDHHFTQEGFTILFPGP